MPNVKLDTQILSYSASLFTLTKWSSCVCDCENDSRCTFPFVTFRCCVVLLQYSNIQLLEEERNKVWRTSAVFWNKQKCLSGKTEQDAICQRYLLQISKWQSYWSLQINNTRTHHQRSPAYKRCLVKRFFIVLSPRN